jgi:hypothetical protein
MKTIPSWACPTLVLGGWLVIAALTLSELATVAPSLRSTAGAERWRPRTACVADASTAAGFVATCTCRARLTAGRVRR